MRVEGEIVVLRDIEEFLAVLRETPRAGWTIRYKGAGPGALRRPIESPYLDAGDCPIQAVLRQAGAEGIEAPPLGPALGVTLFEVGALQFEVDIEGAEVLDSRIGQVSVIIEQELGE